MLNELLPLSYSLVPVCLPIPLISVSHPILLFLSFQLLHTGFDLMSKIGKLVQRPIDERLDEILYHLFNSQSILWPCLWWPTVLILFKPIQLLNLPHSVICHLLSNLTVTCLCQSFPTDSIVTLTRHLPGQIFSVVLTSLEFLLSHSTLTSINHFLLHALIRHNPSTSHTVPHGNTLKKLICS
jgi:hypothetical protein